ncbi:hypothetical protein PP182_00485 [Maribacter sp. PR1]|uniref:Uncharacterized protein n=1 Tax=Maribacter cobaltidurans TaxID=1178778 RepID=A0ABU7INI6_9FLAO|nr:MULTISPECIES: hypothetical protein [Maribacter]MDC6387139.1 hypothetical protein [Maribacter sp. PR1]MEE1974525.1 hypothetical protein [Maribacter cobaltidurans]
MNAKTHSMDKEELLGKELSNLYAISKQVNNFFNDSDISFLSERRKGILANYLKLSCKNEIEIAETLRGISVNPGNTTDSIVDEITDNLQEIISQNDFKKDSKEMSYMMSLNRLMSYHVANIENVRFLLQNVELKNL